MPTLKEKVFSRITEDFQVLAKIVIRQLNLTKQLMDDNHKEEIYRDQQQRTDHRQYRGQNPQRSDQYDRALQSAGHESEDDHLLLRYDRLSRTDRRSDSECFPFHEKNSSRRLSVHNL